MPIKKATGNSESMATAARMVNGDMAARSLMRGQSSAPREHQHKDGDAGPMGKERDPATGGQPAQHTAADAAANQQGPQHEGNGVTWMAENQAHLLDHGDLGHDEPKPQQRKIEREQRSGPPIFPF